MSHAAAISVQGSVVQCRQIFEVVQICFQHSERSSSCYGDRLHVASINHKLLHITRSSCLTVFFWVL